MKKPVKSAPNLHIKGARERLGWSQEYVAQQIGTDAFTVSRWERGVTMPSPHFRQKLSTLFDLSATDLGLVPQEKEEIVDHVAVPSNVLALTQTPILDPSIPSMLVREHGLVGRDDMLQQLKQQLLIQGQMAVSALMGLPGVGKTALATTLAHDEEVRAHFPAGILWMGLGRQPDILGGLSRWGSMLGNVPPDQTQRSNATAWAASVHSAIGQRRALLIIDDAWDIADALAFQVGGPNCAHLVTTRFPELARRFATRGAIEVHELDNTDGRLLLMRLAPEVVQAEPEEAQALVTAVGGLPLALTLLGNYLRVQAHSGQPRRLRAALERLRKADERLHLAEPQPLIGIHPSLSTGTPLSLQAMIGISDQQISIEARSTLRALSIFPPKPNTFSEEAALAVSTMPVEMLDALTDTGLLECSGAERYTLHQTIADYAHTHLDDMSVAGRMVTYFVNYVETHVLDYAALDRESTNIQAALELAFEHDMLAELIRGVHAFASWLEIRGLYTAAEVQLQRSLEAAQTLGDLNGQANVWLQRGKIAWRRGNHAQAQTYLQNGLSVARLNEQSSSEAQLLRELGNIAWLQGQPEQARLLYEEALATLRQSGDPHNLADTLKSLGNVAADQGQPEQARVLYEEALSIFRSLEDVRGIAVTLQNLGILMREQGQPEQARVLYEEALSIFRNLGDLRSITFVLNNLGNLTRQQGHFEQARQFLEEALSLFRSLESQHGFAFTLFNLGNLAIDQQHFEQAHQHLNEALAIFHNLQDRRSIALTLHAQGNLARIQKQFEQAHQYLNEALAIFQDLQDRRHSALTHCEQGRLEQDQGEFERARQLYNEALASFEQLGDLHEIAVTRQELATLTGSTHTLGTISPK